MVGVRGVWILAGLLLGACDIVFRIDRIGVGDGMPDALDASNDGDAQQQAGCETDTHDEDGDGVADACDRCPGIADDQTDSDMDGVGDLCDPSSQAKHDIALFLSFAGNDVWTTVAGNWPRDGESLVYDAVTLDDYGVALYQGAVPAPPFVVEYHFSVDSIQAQGSGFQVILDSDDTGRGVTCGLQRHESPTMLVTVHRRRVLAHGLVALRSKALLVRLALLHQLLHKLTPALETRCGTRESLLSLFLLLLLHSGFCSPPKRG